MAGTTGTEGNWICFLCNKTGLSRLSSGKGKTSLGKLARPSSVSAQVWINPLNPYVNVHILLTLLHVFLVILVGRVCLNIKTFNIKTFGDFFPSSHDLYV